MATRGIEICNICGESMIDPRILPICAHSFCLKCLESLKESPKCPTCQIKFDIPEGGLQEIKKNAFIERLNNFSKILIKCEVCNENEAIKFCVDCKFHYCLTCLKPHERIPTTKDHILRQIKNQNVDKTYSNCEVHAKSMDLYCEDCKVLSCGECVALNHVNHKMKNLSEHVESIIKIFESIITMKNGDFKRIVTSHDNTEKLLNENETNACLLKKQLYEIGESIKNCVDSIVTKLHGDIDEILHKENPGNVLVTLKEMKNKIKIDIASLERNLNDLNYSNFDVTSQEIMKNIEGKVLIPNFAYKFNKDDVFKNNKSFTDLQKFTKTFQKVQRIKNIKIIDLEYHFPKEKTNEHYFSIASIQDEIVASDGSNRIKVFGYDGLQFVGQYDCNLLSKIIDMLAVDDKLYVAGRDNKGDVVVVKYDDDNFRSDPFVFFKLTCISAAADDFKLSKSYGGKISILLIFKNKIYQLSDNLNFTNTIELEFNIKDALQIGERTYCVCRENNEICWVNDESDVIIRFSPPENIFSIHEAHRLVSDNFGFIYVTFIKYSAKQYYSDILVLDYNLNFVSTFNDFTLNCTNICYSESKNMILVNNNSQPLKINFNKRRVKSPNHHRQLQRLYLS